METREQIIARVQAEYEQHLAEWRASHPGWEVDWRARNGGQAFRPLYRSIEREPARYVLRTIHPYVGITSLRGRLLK